MKLYDLFNDNRIRLLSVLLLGGLQMLNRLSFFNEFSDSIFLVVNLGYAVLGFLSITQGQALQNIALLTLPILFLLTLIMFLSSVMNSSLNEFLNSIGISLMVWSTLLCVGVLAFVVGFIIRLVAGKYLMGSSK